MKRWFVRGSLNLIYATLLLLFAPILIWQQLRGTKRRSNWSDRLLGPNLNSQAPLSSTADSANQQTYWLHAVSVGEVNLLQTLLPALRQQYPQARFAISASTDTGLELAKNKFPDDIVFRFPFDFSWAVARIFRQLRPTALILTELEIWPNTIGHAAEQNVPVIVVNGRLSEKSFRRYQKVRSLISHWFRSLALVAAQTEDYSKRFQQLGVPIDRIHTVGSMKFDAAETDRGNQKTSGLMQRVGLTDSQTVFLAGSTSAGEEAMACQAFSKLKNLDYRLKLILVPRHRERFEEVAELVHSNFSQFRLLRRSAITTDHVTSDWDILLVDTIGELSAWWGCAQVGFVGGSFGSRGGQSMIEPAGFGVATCFGPNTSNFRDVVDLLLSNQAAVRVKDQSELETFLQRCLDDREFQQQIGNRAQELVVGQNGATDRTLTEIQQTLAGFESAD